MEVSAAPAVFSGLTIFQKQSPKSLDWATIEISYEELIMALIIILAKKVLKKRGR